MNDEHLKAGAWLLGMAASGKLKEAEEILKAEARARWKQDSPPGQGYSKEAQAVKMAKAEAKRLRRSGAKASLGLPSGNEQF